MKTTLDDIIDLVKGVLSITGLEIVPEDNLKSDLGIDSMGAVELVTKIEEKYNIVVDEIEIFSLGTINDLVNFINSKLAVIK